jgi:hypothetical protein
VDNNPARVLASRYFRELRIPVIFTAVTADGDHGYVFIQEASGPCFGCLFPLPAKNERWGVAGLLIFHDL